MLFLQVLIAFVKFWIFLVYYPILFTQSTTIFPNFNIPASFFAILALFAVILANVADAWALAAVSWVEMEVIRAWAAATAPAENGVAAEAAANCAWAEANYAVNLAISAFNLASSAWFLAKSAFYLFS